MERKITVGTETAKVLDLQTEFQLWSDKFTRFIEQRHGDGFASVYSHVDPHLKALYDVLRYELGLSIEIDRDMDAGEQEQEQEEHQVVNKETFLMTSSVILAQQCLEDIEEVNDGKEFVERMMEAHRHLTEAIEIYNTHEESELVVKSDPTSKSEQLWK